MPIATTRMLMMPRKRRALFFDGADDRVDFPLVSLNITEFSLCALVKSCGPNVSNTVQVVIDLRGERRTFLSFETDMKFRFYINDGTTIYNIYSSPKNYNIWYFVTAVFDGSLMHLYINGIEEVPPVTATPPAEISVANRIGKDYDLTKDRGWWYGEIALVQIYNRALSDGEVLQNYNSIFGYGDYVKTGLVLDFDFEEAWGDYVIDKSGNGNAGVIYG